MSDELIPLKWSTQERRVRDLAEIPAINSDNHRPYTVKRNGQELTAAQLDEYVHAPAA